jgi:hypothetical protein
MAIRPLEPRTQFNALLIRPFIQLIRERNLFIITRRQQSNLHVRNSFSPVLSHKQIEMLKACLIQNPSQRSRSIGSPRKPKQTNLIPVSPIIHNKLITIHHMRIEVPSKCLVEHLGNPCE